MRLKPKQKISFFKDPLVIDIYDRVMKLNLRSVVYLTHLAVEHLEKTKGVIINVSSVAGLKPVSNFFILILKKRFKKFLNLFDSWCHFSFIVCLKVL